MKKFSRYYNYTNRPSGETYIAEASALFARMTVQPDATRKGLIQDLISSLKDDGLWNKIDVFYVFAAHTEQASLLNWKSTSYNCTAYGTPTFTTDVGFTGGSNKYLDTNFDLSTNATYFTLNSGSLYVYLQTVVTGAYCDIGVKETALNRFTSILLKYNNSACWYGINQVEANAGSIPASFVAGFYGLSRTASNVIKIYNHNSSLADRTNASTAIPSGTVYIMARHATAGAEFYSARKYSFACIGAGLNLTETTNLATALETYLDAIGAGQIP